MSGARTWGSGIELTGDRRPRADDVIIYKLDALTYHLWLGTRPCGSFISGIASLGKACASLAGVASPFGFARTE